MKTALVLSCLSAVSADNLGPILGLGHDMRGHNHTQIAGFGGSLGGAEMSRVYTQYEGLPVGEAQLKSAGWKKSSKCDSKLGYAWTFEKKDEATRAQPLKLYTNGAGQPSGVGVIMFNYMPTRQQKWATQSPIVGPPPKTSGSNQVFHIDVAFRKGSNQCSTSKGTNEIGEVLIVNPNGNSKSIPVTEPTSGEWQRGSCFASMGWHWFLNTAGGTLPTGWGGWQKSDIFPVVAMYDKGKINAIFFASVTDQHSADGSTNKWETKALPDLLMCQNFCGLCRLKARSGEPDGAWGTMHIFFKDHTTVKCPNTKCLPFTEMGCCEKNLLDESLEARSAPVTGSKSQDWLWAVIGAGAGLAVGASLFGFSVIRQRRARELQVSEMSSNLQTS